MIDPKNSRRAVGMSRFAENSRLSNISTAPSAIAPTRYHAVASPTPVGIMLSGISAAV